MAVTEAPPRADLGFLLAQANHALGTELTARLAELGITPRDQCVLSTALSEELTQNHLAELCALDKTTMVVTIDGLEKAGLAERRPSATDRRARIISVTPQGERVARQAKAIIGAVYEDVLGELDEPERTAFVGALTHLTAGRLSKPSPCERPPRRRAPRS
jgi:MarR family transcriptional regulator, transcriptional regulator for hemolysin